MNYTFLTSHAGAAASALRPSRSLRLMLCTLFFMFFIAGISAVQAQDASQSQAKQNYTLKGTVSDEFGETLPAVNIYLKGTPTVGTVSKVDGSYAFPRSLAEGEVVVFSFVGYDPLEYVVSSDTSIPQDITLKMYSEVVGALADDELYSSRKGLGRLWVGVKSLFD